MKRIYKFDAENGVATCYLIDKNNTYTGFACCHDDDKDFQSERVGLTLAEARAEIDALKHIRDNELIPTYKALKHLQDNMKTSTYYNPKSYEARMLRRQVCIKENELIAIKQEIDSRKQFISDYIQQKDELHDKLRKVKKN